MDNNQNKLLSKKELLELEFYLDFIAPVNKDQQQSELKYINSLEKELYQDRTLTK